MKETPPQAHTIHRCTIIILPTNNIMLHATHFIYLTISTSAFSAKRNQITTYYLLEEPIQNYILEYTTRRRITYGKHYIDQYYTSIDMWQRDHAYHTLGSSRDITDSLW